MIPPALIRLYRRLAALFRPNALDSDMDREMRAHLELLAEEHERSGLSREEALRAARRRFGNVGLLKERGRDVRGAGLVGDLAQDVRYAVRMFGRSPAFTAVVVASLALGIGANTALFSVVDAAYLRKLPVEDPDTLVGFRWQARDWSPEDLRWASSTSEDEGLRIVRSPAFPRRTFEAFRAESGTLADVFAFANRTGASLTVNGESDSTTVQAVSGNYFTGLGVSMAAGRGLTDEDDDPAATPAAVISYGAWQRQFGGDASTIGRSIQLNGRPFTIVGAADPEFHGTARQELADFLVPLAFETEATGANIEPTTWSIKIMGRMNPGARREQVLADLAGVFQGSAEETAATAPAAGALQLEAMAASRTEPNLGGGGIGPGSPEQIVALLGAVFLILLLIVCMNVANLLTARAAARRYEIGMRLAMGAGRGRLIRQLLTESILLALGGGAAGIVLAYRAKDVIGGAMERPLDLQLNPNVLLFALVVSLLTALVFGLLPAIQATRKELAPSVQMNVRAPGRSRSRLTHALLTAQVALSVVVLAGAGMLVRTLGLLPGDNAGYDTANLVSFHVNLAPLAGDRGRYESMVAAIGAVPGVIGLTTASEVFLSDNGSFTDGLNLETDAEEPGFSVRRIRLFRIRNDFFEMLGLPLVAGRAFESTDTAGATRVAIVTESLARRFTANPIGRRFTLQSGDPFTIVGVVRDAGIANLGLDGTVFLPERQGAEGSMHYAFEVRTAGDPLAAIPAIRAAVAGVDPGLPVYDVATAVQSIEQKLAPTRQMALGWSLFGLLALLLTSIGLYGLLSYTVTRRTGEIGIRMALGARRRHIVSSIAGRTFLLVLAGLVIGLAASRIVDLALRSLVYGVEIYHPASIGIVAAILLGVTGLAACLPVRRAARVDPVIALRSE